MADEMAAGQKEVERQAAGRGRSGHRLVPHTADCIMEAWGPDRVTCITEALLCLVESFADVPDSPATTLVPLACGPAGEEDLLVCLLEDVITDIDVLSAIPVRFHLGETEDGGIAGDMEVVSSEGVELIGPVPKGVSYHELSMTRSPGGWMCHVLFDV